MIIMQIYCNKKVMPLPEKETKPSEKHNPNK